MPRDSVGHTFTVATLLCVVCSVLVSGAAVGLRERQQANKELERKKNILIAAGLFDEDRHGRKDIALLFEKVEPKIIDLETGTEIPAGSLPADYDQQKAARDPQLSLGIPPEKDLANLKQREKYSYVYLVKKPDGRLDQIVLPIKGYGLWSTLYGFLSLDADTTSVRGLTYYEHGETPGLGGEVDNPRWKAKWKGKKAFDEMWQVSLELPKRVEPQSEKSKHQIDAIPGATITSRGVQNMMRYWLGEHGFGPYLKRQRSAGGGNG